MCGKSQMALFSCQKFTFQPKVKKIFTFVYNTNAKDDDDNDTMTGVVQLRLSVLLKLCGLIM